MITRREISGVHLYERKTGFHCLLDEAKVSVEEAELCGPRHLSLMLTDRCNCHCGYCYTTKGCHDMPLSLLEQVCAAAVELQVLDITLGGGEPTLHPAFVESVTSIWRRFPFGLSVTSNGVENGKLLDIAEHVSQLRVSLDPFQKALTSERLDQLRRLRACSDLGVNLLYAPATNGWVENTVDELARVGICNILFIPQHDRGRFVLSEDDWLHLAEVVRSRPSIHFAITADAQKHVTLDLLSTSHLDEYLFAQIDTSGQIKMRSWGSAVGSARTAPEFVSELRKQHPIRRRHYETMD